MFWKKSKVDNEKLDKLGKLLIKSAALNNEMADQAVNSPFLYSKLQANITTLKRSSEAKDNWFAIWSIARYAVPLMTFLAIITISSFWLDSHIQEVTTNNTSAYLPIDVNVAPVTACSISSKTECVVSSNDVLSIVFQPQAQEIKNESTK